MAGQSHTFEPAPLRSLELRKAFGCFGTGVTVITALTAHGPLGMTANSFSSISLDPPLVLWSPAKNSKRHDAFIAADHFCIHVLAADQLALARHFAAEGTDFAAFDWANGPQNTPSLQGCLAEFHCKTYAVHPAGDHSLILGEVQVVTQHHRNTPGLLFEKGQFGSFAPIDDAL